MKEKAQRTKRRIVTEQTNVTKLQFSCQKFDLGLVLSLD